MIRKLLVCASLGGLLLLGLSSRSYSATPKPGSLLAEQAQPGSKSVSGKVATIESGGHGFTLEVSSSNKQRMDFVVDKNTQIQGQVKEGTTVTVEYKATEDGKFLAVSVTAQA